MFDVVGNVWQWCETPTYPFDGFDVHPIYDDFTSPTFDERHNIIKGGEAFLCPMKHLKKVGSTDITLKNPGNGDKIFLELAGNAGFEYRSYSDFALLCDAPAKFVKYTGIVNS